MAVLPDTFLEPVDSLTDPQLELKRAADDAPSAADDTSAGSAGAAGGSAVPSLGDLSALSSSAAAGAEGVQVRPPVVMSEQASATLNARASELSELVTLSLLRSMAASASVPASSLAASALAHERHVLVSCFQISFGDALYGAVCLCDFGRSGMRGSWRKSTRRTARRLLRWPWNAILSRTGDSCLNP